jgi:predicted metalloprotease with PDZ domain
MPERGFESLCAEVTGLDLDDFFDAAVRGVGELPLDSLLRQHGVCLHLRAASGRDDKGGERGDPSAIPLLTIGATLSDREGKSVFSAVDNGGPAERAGVAPGDIAVALDGIALTASNLPARLKRCHAGKKLSLLVFRGDELLTLKVRPALAPEDTCYLLPDNDADDGTVARRTAWLHGRARSG